MIAMLSVCVWVIHEMRVVTNLSWLNNDAPTYCVHAKNWKYQAVAFTYIFNIYMSSEHGFGPKIAIIFESLSRFAELVCLSRLLVNKMKWIRTPHHVRIYGERCLKQQYCIHHYHRSHILISHFISYQLNCCKSQVIIALKWWTIFSQKLPISLALSLYLLYASS